MANLPIEERLLHYFLAMGAQQTDSAPIPQKNLAFIAGSEKISVVILGDDALVQRNKVIETILSLSSLRGSSQLLYLAAPRLLGTSLDATIFRPYGIGLILFDERRIDEAVPPQQLQPVINAQQTIQHPDPTVFAELTTLKSMYANMERTVADLREDLKAFQRESQGRPRAIESPALSRLAVPQQIFSATSSEGALPSFFENNPWLDVLSKRGRSGNEPIAG